MTARLTHLAIFTFMVMAGTGAQAQNTGVTLNLDEQSPLSKWGRWSYFDQSSGNYSLKLAQDRGRIPLQAHWKEGSWMFKLNKDVLSERHDLFFGLRVAEDPHLTTSIGCMSNSKKDGYGTALCGLQLDLKLR